MSHTKFVRYLALLLAAFVATRLIYFKQIWDTPVLNLLILDSEYYFNWARALASGLGNPPGAFWLSPLYSHVLAALFAATGSQTVGLAVGFNVLLSTTALALVALTAREMFGPPTALVTALLAILYAPWLYYDGMILSASLILCLNAALLYVLARLFHPRSEHSRDAAVDVVQPGRGLSPQQHILVSSAGALCGLSALARPSILIFAGLLCIVLWRSLAATRVRAILLFAGALLIVLAPALIRNWVVAGTPTLTTAAGGINFYIGNHNGASGLYDDLPWVESSDPQREAEAYRAEAERRSGDSLSLAQANRYWGGQALADIAHAPLSWIKLLAWKTYLTLNNAEFANNLSFNAVTWFSPVVSALPLRWGILFPLAAAALILLWRKRVGHYIWLYLFTYLVTGVVFFSASEYRLPLLLILVPAAASFLVQLWTLIAAKNLRLLLTACAIYIVFLVLVNYPSAFARARTRPSMDFQNLGTVAQDHRMFAEAIPLFARALAVDDSLVDARIGLADALWRVGNFDDAREQFALAGVEAPDTLQGTPLGQFLDQLQAIANKHQPDSALAFLNSTFPQSQSAPLEIVLARAALEERLKRYSEALRSYQLAAALDPQNPELIHRAGLMAAWIDDHILADSLYRAALQLYPAFAPSRIELGLLALYRGDLQTARDQIQELRRIGIPDDSLRARRDTLATQLERMDKRMR
jgi:tetratricopeptide (TPR) repeat protein